MTFTDEEIKKLKTMMLFILKKKHKEGGGHCGFHTSELNFVLDELVKDDKIVLRRTIHNDQYFLNLNKNNNNGKQLTNTPFER